MSTPATIKVPRRGLYITLGVIAVLVLVSLFTILNKKWWARRINAKYVLSGDLSQNKELIDNTPLAKMIEMYFHGERWGWKERGAVDSSVEMSDDIPEGESAEAAGEQTTP